jgi:hypothetical protein
MKKVIMLAIGLSSILFSVTSFATNCPALNGPWMFSIFQTNITYNASTTQFEAHGVSAQDHIPWSISGTCNPAANDAVVGDLNVNDPTGAMHCHFRGTFTAGNNNVLQLTPDESDDCPLDGAIEASKIP